VDAVASSGPRGLTHVIHVCQITSQFAHALGHHCGLGGSFSDLAYAQKNISSSPETLSLSDGTDGLQMRRTLQRRLLSGFVNAQRQYGALELKLVSREVAHLRVELKSGEYMPLIRALEINVREERKHVRNTELMPFFACRYQRYFSLQRRRFGDVLSLRVASS
jgi:hypothetical protein